MVPISFTPAVVNRIHHNMAPSRRHYSSYPSMSSVTTSVDSAPCKGPIFVGSNFPTSDAYNTTRVNLWNDEVRTASNAKVYKGKMSKYMALCASSHNLAKNVACYFTKCLPG